MPKHRNLSEFSADTEDEWPSYIEQMNHYFIANDIYFTELMWSTDLQSNQEPSITQKKNNQLSYQDLVALVKDPYCPKFSVTVHLPLPYSKELERACRQGHDELRHYSISPGISCFNIAIAPIRLEDCNLGSLMYRDCVVMLHRILRRGSYADYPKIAPCIRSI